MQFGVFTIFIDNWGSQALEHPFFTEQPLPKLPEMMPTFPQLTHSALIQTAAANANVASVGSGNGNGISTAAASTIAALKRKTAENNSTGGDAGSKYIKR